MSKLRNMVCQIGSEKAFPDDYAEGGMTYRQWLIGQSMIAAAQIFYALKETKDERYENGVTAAKVSIAGIAEELADYSIHLQASRAVKANGTDSSEVNNADD